MEITCVHEHSVCLSLLPEKANILDLGCRGFQFANHFESLGQNVVSVDVDDLIGQYFQVAISDFTGKVAVERSADPQATRINKKMFALPTPVDEPTRSVYCYTLEDFSKIMAVDFWHLIKCDIEGSEYEMIMSWDKPWCKQLSIEFHCHLGQTDEQVKQMEDKLLSLGYFSAKHDKYPAHGLPPNYFDSLWILKDKEA